MKVEYNKFINDNRLCVGIFQTKSFSEEYDGYVKFYQQTIIKKTNENK
jgi:hypothetical protein